MPRLTTGIYYLTRFIFFSGGLSVFVYSHRCHLPVDNLVVNFLSLCFSMSRSLLDLF